MAVINVIKTESAGFVDEFVYVDSLEDCGLSQPPRTCPYDEYVITRYKSGSTSVSGVYWVKYEDKTNQQLEWENNSLAPVFNTLVTTKEDPDAKEVWVFLTTPGDDEEDYEIDY